MYAVQTLDKERNKVVIMTNFEYSTLDEALRYKKKIMDYYGLPSEQLLVVKRGFVYETEAEQKALQEANK